MKYIFFYELIDWTKFASSMEPLLGEGGGIIISALLKMLSILVITPLFIIIPCLCAYLIITSMRGAYHERTLHKHIQNSKS